MSVSVNTPGQSPHPHTEPSPELRRGRRALDGHPEITLLDDWRWTPVVGRWVLQCSLTPAALPAQSPLKTTTWFLLADPLYPWGGIECYPAKVGGISQTYPHQRYNGPGATELLWRGGMLCLSTERRILGRAAHDVEPSTAGTRLLWHVERALTWVEAAAADVLLAANDPYELPDFPGTAGSGWRIGFAESAATFATWRREKARSGLVELCAIPDTHAVVFLASSFRDPHRHSIVTPQWGAVATTGEARTAASASRSIARGAWIRLEECPLLAPWQAPATWGELRAACHAQGENLDTLLQEVVPGLRDGRRHVLLLGFPIPELVGDPACRMHWVAAHLPVLSHGVQTTKGFRPSEQGYWLRDRRAVLRDEMPIEWLAAENWDTEYLASRGRLSPEVTSRQIALVGLGALGSVVAELLVRGGVTNLAVIDGEALEAGNLVRHTLTLSEVGWGKASALADRLNRISPYATVHAIDVPFPPQGSEQVRLVQACDLVIDCTGDDTLLEHMTTFPWARSMHFVSLSLGYQACRLWCFDAIGQRFPHDAFRAHITPWLEREREERGPLQFRREGIGCWHPVFPARADDIWLLASTAVKHIEELVLSRAQRGKDDSSEYCSLAVFEQDVAGGTFSGVHKLAGDG